jgi:uncharacterized membrane protein
MKSDITFVRKTGVIAAFAAVSFALTLIIRIPIPATDGYFNIGDSVIMFSGLLFGPWVGLLVGAFGPALADAVGFPQFVFATAIVKGAEGFLVGVIGRMNRGTNEKTALLALAAGITVLVVGYFVFEAFVYPWLAKFAPFFNVTDFTAALVEVLPNVLQGVVSAAIAFGAWKVSRRAFSPAADEAKSPAE